MEDINLHFTGDFHAIASAHNLLSAMLTRISITATRSSRHASHHCTAHRHERPRLRNIIVGSRFERRPAREERFVIIPGSEIMAIMALATGIEDLEQRLARIIVADARQKGRARERPEARAMTLLLKDAINPNLVQTLEGGRPSSTAAVRKHRHGCNSWCDKLALTCATWCSRGGIRRRPGAEKFFDIKCRMAGLNPEAAIVVPRCGAQDARRVKKDALGRSTSMREAGATTCGATSAT